MKYAVLAADLTTVLEIREWDVLPPHKPGRVVPVVESPPAHDPATERVSLTGYVVTGGQAVAQYAVTPLTAAEIEARDYPDFVALKKALTGLVTTINLRLAAGQKITAAELKQAIKDAAP